ncbi:MULTISPECIES: Hsp70 family protein [Deefgea]|uniref:Hsp70 family protein n=1 Tax=Deefgea chitinilytica TaxID=570276 RepID=A0ABS2C8S5_9NEIS|nr:MULTISPECIES: Hsp70 family protein [Deefgea]MBM5570545.1 Hsp70 family protein [Deefgea chitinilytica]MBM9887774.1 Hsp70 family protein [Deefgea sp. CFH1-16]
MKHAIGFDFGTTNSLISIIVGDRVISLLDGNMPHPSVVCYQGDQIIVGRKAKERLANMQLGVIGNIVRSPKTRLGEPKIWVDDVARNPKEIVADLVRYVKNAAQEQQPGQYDHAVVTIPVDMQGHRRAELRDAFRMAGMSIVQFVHEPLAALYGHLRNQDNFEQKIRELNRELVLVFDWGGGTLDLTLCKIMDGMLLQIKNDGCSDVGGDVLDEMIVNEVVRRSLAERNITDEVLPRSGARQKLLARAEAAKISLSDRSEALVYVPSYFDSDSMDDPDLEFTLKRADFEAMVSSKIESGIQRIHNLLNGLRINPSQISLCLATGGMVNMPMIQSRLLELFGPQCLHVSERGATVISEGAAWIAHDRANLKLAKNIEVLVAGQTHFPVIKANVDMPREGEVSGNETINLYCTDPRDGKAKIQLTSPERPGRTVQGTDTRSILENLSVKVDSKSRKLFERVELKLSIDENLILHAEATASLNGDRDFAEVHNLEFGLSLPDTQAEKKKDMADLIEWPQPEIDKAQQVCLRSNVAPVESEKVVPGDFLYQIKPRLFDREAWDRATDLQIAEHLYYQPCSICRRPTHHPECKCAS